MKRTLIKIMVVTMIIVLANCAFVVTETMAEKVKIVHWQHHHTARTPIVEGFVKTYAEQNLGVPIAFEAIPYDSYFIKLMAALANKTGADVFQVPIELAEQLIQGGVIAPVPESVMTTEQIDKQFVPWTVERFKADGKYYGLPTDVQTLLLFINVDLFKECGGDPANPPLTWEDLKTWAEKGTKRDASGAITQAGLDTRFNYGIFTQAMYSYIDGPVVDVAACKVNYDGEQGLAAWNMVASLMVGPNAVDSPEFLTGQRKFEQGKAVFYINYPVARGTLKLQAPDMKYIIVPAPVPAGKDAVVVGRSWAYVVNAESKNPEEAWKWIKYITNKEAQMKWSQLGGDVPSLTELLTDPSLLIDDNAKVVLNSMKYAHPVQQVGKTEVGTIQAKMWERIVIKKELVETVVKDAAKAETEVIQNILGCK